MTGGLSSTRFAAIASMSLRYRSPRGDNDDVARCHEIEAASYPADDAASLEALTYRQEHAPEYFQLCTVAASAEGGGGHGDEEEEETAGAAASIIVGFVCGTRCNDFTEESMATQHDPHGRLLAIHSVVVDDAYRGRGVATAMLQHYVETIVQSQQQQQQQSEEEEARTPSIQSIVLLAKKNLLSFYVNCGFQVNRPSPIVHGKELWYELERKVTAAAAAAAAGPVVRTLPLPGESWFCKTERFKRPFPEVKPHLADHAAWVHGLRREGRCITSGYRVDADGRPGGGGLMFLAARSYDEARDVVLQDPLVANDCVEWELNGWVGQVGDIQMR